MEQQTKTLASQIHQNSLYHLLICAITALSSIALITFFRHTALIITLAVTSTITLISGITGLKINTQAKKPELLRHFFIEILLLASWDFGGVICVISIAHSIKTTGIIEKVLIILLSCLVYIGLFIYFWRTFLVVNKFVGILNRKRNGHYGGITSARAYIESSFIENEKSIDIIGKLSSKKISEMQQVSINSS